MKIWIFLSVICCCFIVLIVHDMKKRDDELVASAEFERQVNAVMTNLSKKEITDMWLEISTDDKRPEAIRNNDILREALKRLKKKNGELQADQVNEKLKAIVDGQD